jgi:hypothetical protein
VRISHCRAVSGLESGARDTDRQLALDLALAPDRTREILLALPEALLAVGPLVVGRDLGPALLGQRAVKVLLLPLELGLGVWWSFDDASETARGTDGGARDAPCSSSRLSSMPRTSSSHVSTRCSIACRFWKTSTNASAFSRHSRLIDASSEAWDERSSARACEEVILVVRRAIFVLIWRMTKTAEGRHISQARLSRA